MKRKEKSGSQPKHLIGFTSEAVDLDEGFSNYQEVIEAEEQRLIGHLTEILGIPVDWKPEKGAMLTQEQSLINSARWFFKRLKAIVPSDGFDRTTAITLINFVGGVQGMLHDATVWAHLEGRREVYRWIAEGFKAGKLKTQKQEEVAIRTILKQMKSDTDRNRLKVCFYLWKEYPAAKEQISPERLCLLPKAMKNKARRYLRGILKGLQKENQIKEVFKRPDVSKAIPGVPEHHL